MKDRYVLCFKEKNNEGKEEVYPIYESSLIYIDMYTSYKHCLSGRDLYKLLPPFVLNFINANFNVKFNLEDNFFIRKSCNNIKKVRTDLPILYKQDADIVYANTNDILNALNDMKIEEGNYSSNDEITKIKKEFFREMYDMLFDKESKMSYEIDKKVEKYDLFSTRFKSICTKSFNLKIIADYVSKDYELKRKFLLLLKEYKKKIDDIKGVKTWLVEEKELNARQNNRAFSINSAISNMKKLYDIEKEYYSKNYPVKNTEENVTKIEKKTNTNSKLGLENNPDYIEYMRRYIDDDEDFRILDDFIEEDEEDDFLGPKKPNDPRYRGIN